MVKPFDIYPPKVGIAKMTVERAKDVKMTDVGPYLFMRPLRLRHCSNLQHDHAWIVRHNKALFVTIRQLTVATLIQLDSVSRIRRGIASDNDDMSLTIFSMPKHCVATTAICL